MALDQGRVVQQMWARVAEVTRQRVGLVKEQVMMASDVNRDHRRGLREGQAPPV